MAAITAAVVKALRDRTGLPMMKCKTALVEADGDVETATTNLRKQGVKAAKSQLWMAYAASRAAQAQKRAVSVQRGAVFRASKRLKKIHKAGAISRRRRRNLLYTWPVSSTQTLGEYS